MFGKSTSNVSTLPCLTRNLQTMISLGHDVKAGVPDTGTAPNLANVWDWLDNCGPQTNPTHHGHVLAVTVYRD